MAGSLAHPPWPTRMHYVKSVLTICFLVTACAPSACNGTRLPMTTQPTQRNGAEVPHISPSDWKEILQSDRSAHRRLKVRIKLTDVSAFGGFYAKGHLVGSPSSKVHLIWQPDATPKGPGRDKLVEGRIVTVTGEFQGVTAEGEAILNVSELKD
ncbi:hypothetical protein GMST_36180 [Geomonas silvestris]|uniref:Uncharacterized protein n=1 Tax=Geomonas silvestris TaxID=2740184 RepID=A0A6V8MNL1_9BACT|nr:hypothetical protein [Geomonas silvestris]GFO61293.1 hypothetical protein GMST_36180 [Geomonas silvestris]